MSDAVRWGILSTADINEKLLAGAAESDKVEVLAVASRDAARAEAYAREQGIERSYGSYDDMLADPDVEAVYISLPNSMHVDWSIRALEAGKHVLCEKPLSRHPGEVERAFDAADRTGRILMEAFMWRHNPQTAKLKELVDGGAIGELRLVRAAFSFPLADPTNVRLNAELDGGGADGRRLLLRLRLAAARAASPSASTREQRRVADRRRRAAHRRRCASRATSLAADRLRHRRSPNRDELEAIGAEGSLFLDDPWHCRRPVIEHRTARRRRADRARAAGLVPPGAREPGRRAPRRGGAAARPRGRARPGAHDRGAVPLGGGGPAGRALARLLRPGAPTDTSAPWNTPSCAGT